MKSIKFTNSIKAIYNTTIKGKTDEDKFHQIVNMTSPHVFKPITVPVHTYT